MDLNTLEKLQFKKFIAEQSGMGIKEIDSYLDSITESEKLELLTAFRNNISVLTPQTQIKIDETEKATELPIKNDLDKLSRKSFIYIQGYNINEDLVTQFIAKSSFNIGIEIPLILINFSENAVIINEVLFTDKGIYYNCGPANKKQIKYNEIEKVEFGSILRLIKIYKIGQLGPELLLPALNMQDVHQNLLRIIGYFQKLNSEIVEEISCPECHSKQITYNQKGYSGGKAFVGGILVGGLGLLAGFHRKNKILLSCLKCGHQWQAGK